MSKDVAREIKINPLPTMSYPTYDEREQLKREFFKEYPLAKDPWIKALLILHKLCWAHYWRTMDTIRNLDKPKSFMKKILGEDYREGRELSLYEYASHWLYNEQFSFDKDMFSADEDVLRILKDLWGIAPTKHPMLAVRDSYYRDQK